MVILYEEALLKLALTIQAMVDKGVDYNSICTHIMHDNPSIMSVTYKESDSKYELIFNLVTQESAYPITVTKRESK